MRARVSICCRKKVLVVWLRFPPVCLSVCLVLFVWCLLRVNNVSSSLFARLIFILFYLCVTQLSFFVPPVFVTDFWYSYLFPTAAAAAHTSVCGTRGSSVLLVAIFSCVGGCVSEQIVNGLSFVCRPILFVACAIVSVFDSNRSSGFCRTRLVTTMFPEGPGCGGKKNRRGSHVTVICTITQVSHVVCLWRPFPSEAGWVYRWPQARRILALSG